MSNKIERFTEEELKNIKIANIMSVVKTKLTAEEFEAFKTSSNEDRRGVAIALYEKYIGEVIAEVDSSKGDEEAEAAKAAVEEAAKKEAEEASAKQLEENSTKAEKGVNIDISFTSDIRGIAGFNGSRTMSCEKLLLLAFRNPKAKITFRSQERAKQFIDIVKGIEKVKGISNLTPDAKKRVIDAIKVVNGL